MITNDISPKQFLLKIRVIYFSLWGGLTTFLIMVLFLTNGEYFFQPDLSDPLLISTFFLACITLPAGYMFAKKTFSKIDQNDILKNKLTMYLPGQIIRLATCEGIGILALVSLNLTSNLFFLVFLLISLFIMILYSPTPDKIGRDLNLTQQEIDTFNN